MRRLQREHTQSAYNLALSDRFHPPIIYIHAKDNVLVAQVIVKILNDHGQTLQQDEATRSMKNDWEFAPAATGRS